MEVHLLVYQNPSQSNPSGFWWAFFSKKILGRREGTGGTMYNHCRCSWYQAAIDTTSLLNYPFFIPFTLNSTIIFAGLNRLSYWCDSLILEKPVCHALFRPVLLDLHIHSHNRAGENTEAPNWLSWVPHIFLSSSYYNISTSVITLTEMPHDILAFPVGKVMFILAQVH